MGRGLARIFLRLNGWRVAGDWPEVPKAIVVGAPHTSNWDAIFFLCAAFYYRINAGWMGKAALTRGPFGGMMRTLGCIPVERGGAKDLVAQMKDAFDQADELYVGVAPEATRTPNDQWKSGWHRIAVGAGVPVIIARLDYTHKRVGVWHTFTPTGDYDVDLATVLSYLDKSQARVPENFALPVPENPGADHSDK